MGVQLSQMAHDWPRHPSEPPSHRVPTCWLPFACRSAEYAASESRLYGGAGAAAALSIVPGWAQRAAVASVEMRKLMLTRPCRLAAFEKATLPSGSPLS